MFGSSFSERLFNEEQLKTFNELKRVYNILLTVKSGIDGGIDIKNVTKNGYEAELTSFTTNLVNFFNGVASESITQSESNEKK